MPQTVGNVGGTPVPNMTNMSSAIDTLESRQQTLSNMLDALANILYGVDTSTTADAAKTKSGFEARLNELVAAGEVTVKKLDIIISKL